ncbi:techylectin-5A-like [Clytia hemisphaerica]|uniref:techylectin-5A-like n=1 Tax=Clytia hemisphaerica TaxID=252671 RepID=UPI0034D66B96
MKTIQPLLWLISFVTSVNSLTYECGSDDVLFTKSKVGIEIFSSSESIVNLNITEVTKTPDGCFSKCKRIGECKSATFIQDTEKCYLKSINRFGITSKIKLSANAQYFEKRECESGFGSKIKFISLVKNATDCKDIYKKGWQMNGVYGIEITGELSTYRSIHCRMSLVGGGWTVIQRRVYGTTYFQNNWDVYKEGFGDLSEDFWYGNENIHQLSKPGTSNEIIFELKDFNNDFYYPYYDGFNIGDENDKYELNVGEYKHIYGPILYIDGSIDAGKDFKRHSGNKFSTKDSDNDDSDRHCSQEFSNTGWWFFACAYSNLNGAFRQNFKHGMKWNKLTTLGSGQHKSLLSSVMMVRKR